MVQLEMDFVEWGVGKVGETIAWGRVVVNDGRVRQKLKNIRLMMGQKMGRLLR